MKKIFKNFIYKLKKKKRKISILTLLTLLTFKLLFGQASVASAKNQTFSSHYSISQKKLILTDKG